MRMLFCLAVCFLVSACGVKRQPVNGAGWPAVAISYAGFTGSDESAVRGSIEKLNSNAGSLVVDPNSFDEGYPIEFSVVQPNAAHPSRVGYAIRSYKSCRIELSSELFTTKKDMLMSVVWHEIGHCAGLRHNEQPGTIMFPTTAAFSTYSQEALSLFFNNLLDITTN